MMTDTINKKPCYIPLSLAAQNNSENVLYYNANASQDSIYQCAMERLYAVINLADSLFNYKEASPQAIQSFSVVVSLLVNEACTLLEEVNPVAVELRASKKVNNND